MNFPKLLILEKSVSIPIANSKKAMPNSEINGMETSVIRFKNIGPIIIPAIMYIIKEGCFKNFPNNARSVANTTIMPKSKISPKPRDASAIPEERQNNYLILLILFLHMPLHPRKPRIRTIGSLLGKRQISIGSHLAEIGKAKLAFFVSVKKGNKALKI